MSQELEWKEASSLDTGDLVETVLSEEVQQDRYNARAERSNRQATVDYTQALAAREGLTPMQEQFSQALIKHRSSNARRGPGFFSIPYTHRVPTKGV